MLLHQRMYCMNTSVVCNLTEAPLLEDIDPLQSAVNQQNNNTQ